MVNTIMIMMVYSISKQNTHVQENSQWRATDLQSKSISVHLEKGVFTKKCVGILPAAAPMQHVHLPNGACP